MTEETKFTESEYNEDYDLKLVGLENVLGEMHSIVGHAIVPFRIGGAVDMYYFTKHIPGTGFATMELTEPDGNGPKPNSSGTYELLAFTRNQYKSSEDGNTPFELIERRICGIFTATGFYSREAILNRNDTCEIPTDEGDNICIVFDNYVPDGKVFKVGSRQHQLLLCIEIFRSEMDFARSNGSSELLDKLKSAGYYPYSDMDRPPTV